MIQLFQGDCLDILSELPEDSIDAVIADPPYSSGGRTAGERSKPPSEKYEQSDNHLKRPDFLGDNLDQRSWIFWSKLWMEACLRVLKPEGYLLAFTDWRQLPATTDAL